MRTVLNAFQLLEEIARSQPVGVTALAKQVGMSKSGAQRGLLALESAGWIRQARGEPTRWVLTARALIVGRHVGEGVIVRELALPAMQEVNDLTEETVHLNVLDADSIVLIERLETKRAVRTYNPVGGRAPLHATSNGKAMMARMAEERVEAYISRGLEQCTPMTITDPEKLREELDKVRRRGYAACLGEWREDVNAVAAAILDTEGRPVGGISISAPAHRVPRRKVPEYGEIVIRASKRIAAAHRYAQPEEDRSTALGAQVGRDGHRRRS